jgi:hypothetical protein
MASRFWVGGTGTWDASSTTHWSTASGGAAGASAPGAADAAIFDGNSGSGTVTTSGALTVTTFNMTTAATVGVTLGNSLTVSGTASGLSNTLDLNNQTLTCNIYSTSTSSTRTLAFGTSGVINITGNNGTVFSASTATGLTVTGNSQINLTYSGNTGTRQINGGGTTQITEENTINFNITAGTDSVTVGGGNSYRSINFTGFNGTLAASTSARTIYGGLTLFSGMTVAASTGVITFRATSGTNTITTNNITVDLPITFNGVGGTWAFADALTQGSTRAFTITNGTVKLKTGVTSTVGAFATSGSTQKYLQSTLAGSKATLSQASGTVTVSYLTIQDIATTGGATWNAYVDYNNVDNGDNSGWDFSNSPAIDNEFPIALRSFTQPKRF